MSNAEKAAFKALFYSMSLLIRIFTTGFQAFMDEGQKDWWVEFCGCAIDESGVNEAFDEYMKEAGC